MARTKAVLGNGARLTDYLSTSLLARVYPASLVGELLDGHPLTRDPVDPVDPLQSS